MKHLFFNLALLLGGITLCPLLTSPSSVCPCVTNKCGSCGCSRNGAVCNCIDQYAKQGSVPASCPCPKTDVIIPVAEISHGELFDKITILEIKNEQMSDREKLTHINTELKSLTQILSMILTSNPELEATLTILKSELKNINWQLWQVEDKIRLKEVTQSFDDEFIDLARSIYLLNDQRAVIKNKISIILKSHFIEQKSYVRY